MKYAQILNDTIVEIHNKLPSSWNNISNLDALTTEQLCDLSWSNNYGVKFYPVVEQESQSADRRFYTVEGPNYTIDEVKKVVNEFYSFTPKSLEQAWTAVRIERNSKLAISDWTQLPDAPLNEQQRNFAATYRQQLRDITEQSDPFNIVWPETIINQELIGNKTN